MIGYPTELDVAAIVALRAHRATAPTATACCFDSGAALPLLCSLAGFVDAPDEWWLDVEDDRTDAVATALEERPDVAEDVVTARRGRRTARRRPEHGRRGARPPARADRGGGLVVGALLLLSVVLLRRRERAGQDRTLVTLGAQRRDLLGVLGSRVRPHHRAAMVAGVALGARGRAGDAGVDDARSRRPSCWSRQPELHVPGPSVALPLLAMLAVPLLAMVLLTGTTPPAPSPPRRERR